MILRKFISLTITGLLLFSVDAQALDNEALADELMEGLGTTSDLVNTYYACELECESIFDVEGFKKITYTSCANSSVSAENDGKQLCNHTIFKTTCTEKEPQKNCTPSNPKKLESPEIEFFLLPGIR